MKRRSFLKGLLGAALLPLLEFYPVPEREPAFDETKVGYINVGIDSGNAIMLAEDESGVIRVVVEGEAVAIGSTGEMVIEWHEAKPVQW